VSYELIQGVEYGPDASFQTVDLYLPDPARRRSTTLFIVNHGSGDKLPWARRFAERGYPVLFVNVRRREPYPEPVEDAFCALSWAHAQAGSYGFDPGRILALGHSGGAVLAAHLGTVDDRARYMEGCASPLPQERWLLGVASISGIFDYRTEEEFGSPHNAYTPRYFGGSKEGVPDVWREASPITWAGSGDPPFLLVHGTADEMVLPVQSERSAALLGQAGVEADLVLVPGADHDSILGETAFEAVESFIGRLSGEDAAGTPGASDALYLPSPGP
jgi:acetyl esterase/lipase